MASVVIDKMIHLFFIRCLFVFRPRIGLTNRKLF